MIITDKESAKYTLRCDTDGCDVSAEYPTSLDWKEFLITARKDSWKTPRNENGDWEHYCPACSARRTEQRAKHKEELLENAPKKLIKACPDCSKDMFLRKSNYGGFYGCSEYPGCKGRLTVQQGADTL